MQYVLIVCIAVAFPGSCGWLSFAKKAVSKVASATKTVAKSVAKVAAPVAAVGLATALGGSSSARCRRLASTPGGQRSPEYMRMCAPYAGSQFQAQAQACSRLESQPGGIMSSFYQKNCQFNPKQGLTWGTGNATPQPQGSPWNNSDPMAGGMMGGPMPMGGMGGGSYGGGMGAYGGGMGGPMPMGGMGGGGYGSSMGAYGGGMGGGYYPQQPTSMRGMAGAMAGNMIMNALY